MIQGITPLTAWVHAQNVRAIDRIHVIPMVITVLLLVQLQFPRVTQNLLAAQEKHQSFQVVYMSVAAAPKDIIAPGELIKIVRNAQGFSSRPFKT